MLLIVVFAAIVASGAAGICPHTTANRETKPLYLLTLVPFPDPRPGVGWDGGLGTLPGARVARDEINNRTDLLPGHHIELIEENAEACSLTNADNTLLNLVKYGIRAPCRPMPAIIGLICSSHTIALSPIAGHAGVDLLQLAAANSPTFIFENSKFPHLWRFLGSADVYGDAMLALMNQFGWKRIGIVYAAGSDFFTGMARHFERIIQVSPNKEVVFSYGITGTRDLVINQIISNIKTKGVTLLFLCLDSNEIAALLCQAASENIGYPSHLWLLASSFPKHIVTSDLCDKAVLKRAIEGHLNLHTKINPRDESTKLVSGITFKDYITEYERILKEVELDYNQTELVAEYQYSSFLYDQMWAFALALNSSLPKLKNRNLSIDNYTIGQLEVTTVLEEEMAKLSFQGASGYIEFDKYQGVSATVDITNITNVNDKILEVLVGTFNPNMPSNSTVANLTTVPRGEPIVMYIFIPLSAAAFLYFICVLTIIFTAVVSILLIYLRKWPEVKSTSPYLSLFMQTGCFLLSLAVIFNISYASILMSPEAYGALLNIHIILVVNGISFTLVTLFIKLLRIYHIFFKVQLNFGPYWKTCSLAAIVLSLSIIPNIIIAFQIGLDTPHFAEHTSFAISGTQLVAIKRIFPTTRNSFGSFTAILVYFTIFMVLIVYLAVRTRKIEKKNFKDTKKVNLFIALIVFVLALIIPLYILLYSVDNHPAANVVSIIGLLVIAISCQFILFLPKLLPVVVFRGKPPKKGSFLSKFTSHQTGTHTSSFSQSVQTGDTNVSLFSPGAINRLPHFSFPPPAV